MPQKKGDAVTENYVRERLEYLEEVNRKTIDALELAASLGDFQAAVTGDCTPKAVLEDTCSRILKIISFETLVFFLVDEEDGNFYLAYCHPAVDRAAIQELTDELIDEGTFASALRDVRPVVLPGRKDAKVLLLHAMSTSRRVRGMFLGLLPQDRRDIPDTAMSLLSIILLNSANALESIELYSMIRQVNRGLEKTVQERTRQLEHQALHDPLTGLPNRTLIFDRLDHQIEKSKRDKSSLAFMVVDLNRFKEVNDTLGHVAGDKVLVDVGERLHRALRSSDTVGRIGGDEFAVLLPEVADGAAALHVARKLLEGFAEPFALKGYSIDLDASIGVALVPEDGTNGGDIFRKADMAMYSAKVLQTNIARYHPSQSQNSVTRLSLVGELKRAILADQIYLEYQPQVDMRTGTLTGMEALARWCSPRLGSIPPAEFVPLAEQTGLVQFLTEHVLDLACRQSLTWSRQGLLIPIGVNLSAKNLQSPDLASLVEMMLRQYRMAPGGLMLEITESAIMSAPHKNLRVLNQLNDLCVHLAIDDFGTGCSSLAYLKQLPVKTIKIDSSFVRNIHQDSSDRIIVKSIIELAHNLGLNVIAEGVEIQEHLDILSSIGCDSAQGYHIGGPMPADEIPLWIDRFEWNRPGASN